MKKNKKSNPIALLMAVIVMAIVAFATVSSANAAAKPATITVKGPLSGTIEVGQTQKVTWSTSNYKAKTVSVDVIRKVSSNPNKYVLVREIAKSTKDDGSATWVPSASDIGSNIMIQVGCTSSAQACTAGVNTSKVLAVKDSSRFVNTASAYQAIEKKANQ